MFETETPYEGNRIHRAAVSTAISTKRAADALDQIVKLLQPTTEPEAPPLLPPLQRFTSGNCLVCGRHVGAGGTCHHHDKNETPDEQRARKMLNRYWSDNDIPPLTDLRQGQAIVDLMINFGSWK